ncbi:MAG: hypothetical protein MJA83_19550 [Gammaproteobacteria bacterium]|nr:hypothetical protein [Gammaproteobacteria bacterium]
MEKPLVVALKYMKIFYAGREIESLGAILDKDLVFEGPFYKFNSADEYLRSLQLDPPKNMKYEILHAFEKDSSVCLIYRFSKAEVSTYMAQLFETNLGKIKRIILIFDSAAFS